MIEVAVYNQQGERQGSLSVDEAALGGTVRPALLKQAVVAHQANCRQGTMQTRSRGMVAGSTRKLFKQKGTGRARMGPVRTPIRRGGGMAFHKVPRDFRLAMNKKARRLARNNAVLAKLLSQDVLVLDRLSYDAPKTKPFAQLLARLGIDRSCLLAIESDAPAVVLSARNCRGVDVRRSGQMNAYDVLSHRKLLITKSALELLTGNGKAEDTKEE